MTRLADFVNKVLSNCEDSVQEYLEQNMIEEFKPENLLTQRESQIPKTPEKEREDGDHEE